MIWVGGEIVPDDALKVSVLDRTFEHGLGLFETFRTWNGHASLLERHLSRMTRSAAELRLPLDPAALPDRPAVARLLESDGREGDAMLRITMSGGLDESSGSTVWMRSSPLPPPMGGVEGAVVVKSPFHVDPSDPLVRHKTLNYWSKRLAHEYARSQGADEALLDGLTREVDGVLEGSRTNLFAIVKDSLLTLAADAPVLPGVMRSIVAELAPRVGLEVVECEWRPYQAGGQPAEWIILGCADEVFLTNSVRGIIAVRLIDGYEYQAPGPRTARLRECLHEQLGRGTLDP